MKHKVIFVFGFVTLITTCVSAQYSKGGTPPSFAFPQELTAKSDDAITHVPVNFYIKDLQAVDNWRQGEGVPMPVAKLIPVKYGMNDSWHAITLPDGKDIKQLHLQAKNAVALMLYYKDFYIPQGGELYIYNSDKSKVLGAYTHQTNPKGGLFATEFLCGDEVVLEYVPSATSSEPPRIDISEVAYGYNVAVLYGFCSDAGECNVNVNCEEGNAWQNEKKGVCQIVSKTKNYSWCCSGALMNNTAEDFQPYILTAAHCAYEDDKILAEHQDFEQWVFYFHRELNNCSNFSLPVSYKTVTGCQLLANTGLEGGSDGMLLLLNQEIPEDYDVYYNGWDTRNIPAASGVSIHHPGGDYKKISTFTKPATTYNFMSVNFSCEKNAHWNVIFAETANGHGVTEGGSSGSPLYNENKLVVGTLTGGSSDCNSSKNGLNIYGKLNYHWDHFKNDSTRMDIWLDPGRTGLTTLRGRFRKEYMPAPNSFTTVNQGNSILLSWKAPSGNEKPVSYKVFRNNFLLEETNLTTYIDNSPVAGSSIYAVSASYKNGEESPAVTSTVYFVKYKAPTSLTALRPGLSSREVELTWKRPEYEQTIYWGTLDPKYMVGIDDNPFYYGQGWTSEEIAPLDKRTIRAIQFVPIDDNKYEIYISQDNRIYTQPLDNRSLTKRDINTVTLDNPFVIDGSKSLIVAIHVTECATQYPAVCDAGYVIRGKGNLLSPDGEAWEELFEDDDPDKWDMNFIVAAIVSSDKGEIESLPSLPVDYIKKQGVRSASFSTSPKWIKIDETRADNPNPSVGSINSIPAVFPDETKFKIYRSGSKLKEIDASETHYTDKTSIVYYYYEVAAIYGDVETERSNQATIDIVSNDPIDASVDIYPAVFSDYVKIKSPELVQRIDIISVTGKLILSVRPSGDFIDTSSLSPGIYFFRIYSGNGAAAVAAKTVKAVKR